MSPVNYEAMLGLPAATPPAGVTPDFVHPPDYVDKVIAYTAFCVVLATVAMILRLYTKAFIIKSLTRDDMAALCSWMLFITGAAVMFSGTRRKQLWHIWNITAADVIDNKYWGSLGGIFYTLSVGTIKVSILWHYLLVFGSRAKRDYFWWLCWTLATAVFVYTAVVVFLFVFQCAPREKMWRPWIEGTCINGMAIGIAGGVFNVTTDLFVIMIPQTRIWSLHASTSYKVKVSALFLTACLIVVSSAAQLACIIIRYHSPDPPYQLAIQGSLGLTEMTLAIFCSCVPTLNKLLRHCWGKTLPFRERHPRVFGAKRSSSRKPRPEVDRREKPVMKTVDSDSYEFAQFAIVADMKDQLESADEP